MRVPARLVLACALAAALPGGRAAGRDFLPAARAYLVVADGRELWAKDADRPLPPASLTKLMTVLLALAKLPADAVVTVGAAAERETGTRLGLLRGDRLAALDLAAAALVESDNDACQALADAAGGDEAHFVALMNEAAGRWGLAATHFTNACGHDQRTHLASARDLASLAERALGEPRIARLVALQEVEIGTVDGQRRFRLHNANALIGRYQGAAGVKSGYTPKAGKCLVALAERDGHRVLLVLLNAPNRWWDASDTLDRAFAQLRARS